MKNMHLLVVVILHVLDYVLMRVIVDVKDYVPLLAQLLVVITVLAAVNQSMVLLLQIVGVKVTVILVLVLLILGLLVILTLLVIAIMVVVDVLGTVQMLAMEHVVVHVLARAVEAVLLTVVLE